jgi:hypothetical protein
VGPEHLDRVEAVEHPVPAQVHLAHAADGQPALDLVRGECRALDQHRRHGTP